jgi:hypothetical protein
MWRSLDIANLCHVHSPRAAMTEADLYTFLSKHKLGIFTPQLEIIFDTSKDSRKYPNLIAHPACSFVIGGWGTGEQTVQYEGIAEELKPPALARYQETYFATWPESVAHISWPGIVYIVVRPTWIRYSDFDQRPPLIREFTFRAS